MNNSHYGKNFNLNLFPIPKSYFPKIEFALGIKLTEHQKMKLFYPEMEFMGGRRSGRTLCHCILLALSIGEPLRIEDSSDNGDGSLSYRLTYFIKVYADVVEKLESVGFSTRQVGNVGGWKL